MEISSDTLSHPSRSNYFANVTLTLLHIGDTRGSGRLSLRNNERFGLVHLYFKEARLVHVAGNKRDAEAMLNDLLTWSKGLVRFEPERLVEYTDVTWQQAEIFVRWLSLLKVHNMRHGIPNARLDALTQLLTAKLPGKPIALPTIVERYEEHKEQKEAARAQQWQQLNEDVQQFIGQTFSREPEGHMRRLSQLTAHYVDEVVQQAEHVTHKLKRRAARQLRALRLGAEKS